MKFAKSKKRIGRARLLAAGVILASLGTTVALAQSSSASTAAADSSSSAASAMTLQRADQRRLNKIAELNRNEIALSQLASERASNAQVRSFAQEELKSHGQVNEELVALGQKYSLTVEGVIVSGIIPVNTTTQLSASAEKDKAAASGSGQVASTSTGREAEVSGSTGVARDTGVAATGTATREKDVSASVEASKSTESATTTKTMPSPESLVYTSTQVFIPAAELTDNRAFRNLSAKSGVEFDKGYLERMAEIHEDAVDTFKEAAKDGDDPNVRNFAGAHIAAVQEQLDKAKSLKKSLD